MSRHRDWDLSCKVYVGNLGNSASKNELESSFGKYGPLKNVWVARNPPGFAFIEFEDPRDAEDAVRHLDGTRLCGVRIRAEMSTGRTDPSGRGRGSGGGGPPRRGGGDRGYGGGGGGRSRSRSPAGRRRFSRSRSRSHSRSRSRGRRSRSDSRERR